MKTHLYQTNIIELKQLARVPCEKWLKKFQDGKLDAHQAFITYEEQYDWLYRYSGYDLAGWEIMHGCFNWKKHSWVIAKYRPELMDPELYNWQVDSWAIAQYCPDLLDPDRYNWELDSWAVAQYCPDLLDEKRYNWAAHSSYVAKYCPDRLNAQLYNWKDDKWVVEKYCPEKLSLRN